MIKRKRYSRQARVRVFGDGICCICKIKIGTGEKWTLEHIKPLWLGGADDETNIAPAHQHCAVHKTCGEATVRAKTDRQRKKHLGLRKPRTITRWRNFRGEIVTAPRER